MTGITEKVLIIFGLIAIFGTVIAIFYFSFTHGPQNGIVVSIENPHGGSLGDKVVDILVFTKSSGNVTIYSVSNCFRLGDNISVSQDVEGGWIINSPDISGSC